MPTKSYQQQQIDETPERVLSFLRAIATNQKIRFAMAGAGYGDKEQAEGWQLLLMSTGYAVKKLGLNADAAARQAIMELDDWDEPGYRRIHAALSRLHPEQDAFVFAGIEASRGPSAVVGVAKVLDRLDQLEKGNKVDQDALITLSKRGINAELRQHLRGLVCIAQAASPMDLPADPPMSDTQQASLGSLYVWYRDWSETARAVIRRRDHLILMGLAKRHARKEEDETTDEADVSTASSVLVPVITPVSGSTVAT
jgi:hypothetical protein